MGSHSSATPAVLDERVLDRARRDGKRRCLSLPAVIGQGAMTLAAVLVCVVLGLSAIWTAIITFGALLALVGAIFLGSLAIAPISQRNDSRGHARALEARLDESDRRRALEALLGEIISGVEGLANQEPTMRQAHFVANDYAKVIEAALGSAHAAEFLSGEWSDDGFAIYKEDGSVAWPKDAAEMAVARYLLAKRRVLSKLVNETSASTGEPRL